MGNLYKTWKKKRSNKPTPDTSAEKECRPATPESLHISNTATTHLIFSSIEKMGLIYTEQTDRLPITSIQGNKYIRLLYDHYAKSILTESLNNRT